MAGPELQGIRAKASEEGEGCEVIEELELGTVRLGVRKSSEGSEEIFLEPLVRLGPGEDCGTALNDAGLWEAIDRLEASGYVLCAEEGGCISFEKQIAEEELTHERVWLRTILSHPDSGKRGGEGE